MGLWRFWDGGREPLRLLRVRCVGDSAVGLGLLEALRGLVHRRELPQLALLETAGGTSTMGSIAGRPHVDAVPSLPSFSLYDDDDYGGASSSHDASVGMASSEEAREGVRRLGCLGGAEE